MCTTSILTKEIIYLDNVVKLATNTKKWILWV